MTEYFFASALINDENTGDRLCNNVRITVDAEGLIATIETDMALRKGQVAHGLALPGMPNLHAHAFQRAMAGRTEFHRAGESNFWSWREEMYRLAGQMTPESLQSIAAWLYVEMLKAGYTCVGEFHYVHNSHIDRSVDMSRALVSAGAASGIALSLLPVLYQSSDFGGAPLSAAQDPFALTTDGYLRLLEILKPQLGPNDRLGVAFHSLRAVPLTALKAVCDNWTTGPIHIHIAEQQREVSQAQAVHGKRPVALLFDTVDVDARWCLIHATHLSVEERQQIARSGAVIGLCPTTEANLGDGFFPAQGYIADGGLFGIGSDSHISVDPREELRMLEYAERLQRQERTVLAGKDGHCGRYLWSAAASGGAQALGQNAGGLQVGRRADMLVVDRDAPQMIATKGAEQVDAFVFAGQSNPVQHVMVAGKWVVKDGRHINEDEIFKRYKHTVKALYGDE